MGWGGEKWGRLVGEVGTHLFVCKSLVWVSNDVFFVHAYNLQEER